MADRIIFIRESFDQFARARPSSNEAIDEVLVVSNRSFETVERFAARLDRNVHREPAASTVRRVPDEVESVPTTAGILGALRNTDIDAPERRGLILEAEPSSFVGDEAIELAGVLRSFIESRRESNVAEDSVAVASAIRKYLAIAGVADAFAFATSLLRPSARTPLSIGHELELAKMIVRKLVANPPSRADSRPELAERLWDLCETYVNARLIAREKHGAVALNAVLGLLLLESEFADRAIKRVRAMGVPWFSNLLKREATRLATDFAARGVPEKAQRLAEWAAAL